MTKEFSPESKELIDLSSDMKEENIVKEEKIESNISFLSVQEVIKNDSVVKEEIISLKTSTKNPQLSRNILDPKSDFRSVLLNSIDKIKSVKHIKYNKINNIDGP